MVLHALAVELIGLSKVVKAQDTQLIMCPWAHGCVLLGDHTPQNGGCPFDVPLNTQKKGTSTKTHPSLDLGVSFFEGTPGSFSKETEGNQGNKGTHLSAPWPSPFALSLKATRKPSRPEHGIPGLGIFKQMRIYTAATPFGHRQPYFVEILVGGFGQRGGSENPLDCRHPAHLHGTPKGKPNFWRSPKAKFV